MKNQNSMKSTIILNKANSDGFFDFNSSHDLVEAMRALRKMIDEGE